MNELHLIKTPCCAYRQATRKQIDEIAVCTVCKRKFIMEKKHVLA